MKITVFGAGAMGSLFGGYLSRENEVYLVDVDPRKVDAINEKGVRIVESDGSETVCHPTAVTDAKDLGVMDLCIVFVKAMYTQSALEKNLHLIGKKTYVMTLQNGTGHEEILKRFVPATQIIIGTTQHNSSIIEDGKIHHGGGGKTAIGLISGVNGDVERIAKNFTACGFETKPAGDVKRQIWSKLFLNASASALTGILQTPLGYMLDDPHAKALMETLITEAVAVANAEGFEPFEPAAVIADVETVLDGAREGYTSIYADLRDGRRSEVDTISGAVVEAGRRLGVPAPTHACVVELIHALEDKRK